jgi:lysophospholipase L1-like esterase
VLATLTRYICNRPSWFWINSALVVGWLYLLWPLFHPIFLTPIYVAYVATLVLPAIGYAYLAAVGGKKINIGLLIIVIGGLAIGETVLRFRGSPSDGEFTPSFTDGQVPYYMFTGEPNGVAYMPSSQGGSKKSDLTYHLNADGFRIDRPLPKTKPKGELRIFITGGSTVVYGAPSTKTIAGFLESDLSQRGIAGVKVYNFGVIGAVSGQELALLAHKLVDYQPDVVISYGGGNDFHSPYQFDPRPGYPFNFVKTQIGTQVFSDRLDFRTAFASQALRSRIIARVLAPRVQEIRAPMVALRRASGYRTSAWEQSIIDAYRGNLHRACRIGHAFSFRFYAVLQPLIVQKSPLSDTESKLHFGDSDFVAYLHRERDRSAEAFRQLQAEDGADGTCRFIDLSQIFAQDGRNLFWDFIHVNNDGNASIAAAIAADMSKSFFAPATARPR